MYNLYELNVKWILMFCKQTFQYNKDMKLKKKTAVKWRHSRCDTVRMNPGLKHTLCFQMFFLFKVEEKKKKVCIFLKDFLL